MNVQTIFLSSDSPLLAQSVAWLRERFAKAGELNLGKLICTLPGVHAKRRFESLLQWEAAEHDLQLLPPKVITVGSLAEYLYKNEHNLAIDFEQTLAWAHVLRTSSPDRLRPLSPALSAETDLAPWIELASTLRRLHEELASSRVTFAEVALAAENENDRRRWRLLDELFIEYLATLAQASLADPSHSRAMAVKNKRCVCDSTVVLIGTSDLSDAVLAMLRSLTSPRIALVSGDESAARRFNEYGSLKVESWINHVLPIEDRHLVPAGDMFDQALAVAELLADCGDRFSADQITIGVTDESQVGPIEIELRQRGLSVHRNAGWTLAHTAVGRLLNLTTLFLQRKTWPALAALIRHADIVELVNRRLSSSKTLAMSDRWLENFDELMASHYPATLDKPLPPVAKGHFALAEKVRDVLLQWTEPLSTGNLPLSQWCKHIDRLLSELCDDSPDELTADRTQLAYQAIRRQLTRYGKLSNKLDIDVDAVSALQMIAGRSAEIRINESARPNDIEILGWLDLALDDAPALMVVGLNHPFVPGAVTSDPFLPGSLRTKLGVGDNERRYARDCYAMHLMLKSRSAVRFVVGKTSADGSPTPPSRLIAATEPGDCARHVRNLLDGVRLKTPLWHPWDDAPRDQPLTIPKLDRSVRVNTMSVTAFKDYLACPYRFYLRHVLKMRPIDDMASELAANQFGDLVHGAVERFGMSNDKDESSIQRIEDSLIEHLHAYAADTFGESAATAVGLQIAQAQRRLKIVAQRQAERIADGWVIKKVEASVSEKTGAGITVDGQVMGLRGRFDRIDFHPQTGRWAILDYKTHGYKPEKKHLAKRHGEVQWIDLQLPLYRMMIPFLGLGANPDEVELGYFNVSGKDEETRINIASFAPELLHRADEIIVECVRGVLNGHFEPSPNGVEFDDYAAILQTGIAQRSMQDAMLSDEVGA